MNVRLSMSVSTVIVMILMILNPQGSVYAQEPTTTPTPGPLSFPDTGPDISLWFAALFALGMFFAAGSAKALGASIVYAIGLLALYPDSYKASLLVLLYIPAVLWANFRD